MIFRPYLHNEPTSLISYILGCVGHTSGCVVDPVAPPEHYLQESERLGMKILFVIDTHLHRDHTSTGPELARLAGCPYLLHESSQTAIPFTGVKEGDTFKLGNVKVDILHTPGHTREHISLVVTDFTRMDEPWMVLTGHSLLVKDLGRPEGPEDPESTVRHYFQSLQKFSSLPDHVEIYPGAFNGSGAGPSISGKPFSTLGFERKCHQFLSLPEESFVQCLLERA